MAPVPEPTDPVGEDAAVRARESVEVVYRAESRRILATLIRLLGDFDLAEEALHDAFTAALRSWARDGVPAKPRAWLVSTGRYRAIDKLRRRARFDASVAAIAAELGSDPGPDPSWTGEDLEDDRLRLIFTCCHPALPPDGQVALTLREVCGLTTEEIAHAFLTATPTLAQRIVRAKAKAGLQHARGHPRRRVPGGREPGRPDLHPADRGRRRRPRGAAGGGEPRLEGGQVGPDPQRPCQQRLEVDPGVQGKRLREGGGATKSCAPAGSRRSAWTRSRGRTRASPWTTCARTSPSRSGARCWTGPPRWSRCAGVLPRGARS